MIEQAHPIQPNEGSPAALRHLPLAWLWSARVLWLVVFLFMLVLNGAAIAAQLRHLESGGGAAGLKAQLNDAQVYVLTVDPLGPAAKAGMASGNVLLAIDGTPIRPEMSYAEVNALLRGEIGASKLLRVEGAGGVENSVKFTLVEEDSLQIWRRFRVPFGLQGAYLPIIEGILLAAYLLMSGMIFWRRSDDWLALYLSITLVLITPQLSYSWYFLSQTAAHWERTLSLILAVAVAFSLPNFYLLPDGEFVPRWTAGLAALWVVWCITMEIFPEAPFSIYKQPGTVQSLVWLGAFATGMLAQVYRYRNVATPMEQQQIKWVAFGLTIAALVNIGWTLSFELFPVLSEGGQAHRLMWLIGRTAYVLGMMLLPISFGIAIFRYRLWDIDNLINRTLVYGTLTAIVVGIYVVVVTALDLLFQSNNQALSQIIALSLDLVLFEPLRERLQKAVDHLMFGESDELPAVALRLGQRLKTADGPDVVLPIIVETLAESLRLPYVAISLMEGDSFRIAASHGEAIPALFTWPLVYQNHAVGQLIFAQRSIGEPFKPADWELIESISHHISLAVHDLLLDYELQRQKALTQQ